MLKPKNLEEEFVFGLIGVGLTLFSLTFFPLSIYGLILKIKKHPIFSIKIKVSIVFILSFFCFFLWIIHPTLEFYFLNIKINILAYTSILNLGFIIIFIFESILFKDKIKSHSVRVVDFKIRKINIKKLNHFFRRSNSHFPIGVDVKSNRIIEISEYDRTSHFIGIGSTGTGKTTLMINMILHAVLHKKPCVVIDPKGDDSSLNEIIRIGKILDPNFQKRLKVFSMSKPNISACYNPLKHGNPNQIKDRIMEALNWSEQFYQSLSGSFLTTLTSSFFEINETLNLRKLSKILTLKESQADLLNRLKSSYESGNEVALELFQRLNHFFSKSKDSDLSGLAAQIAILDNPTFGELLSFDDSLNEIDLREIRKNSGVAYFQLDTLGNADSARRLGRMIIEDLKSLSSEVYKNEKNESDRVFFPIFIDEFGSFAAIEFVEFLKQSRGARFAIHLFCQGLEDLDKVSSEFRRQTFSNPTLKLALRIDDNQTVNEFCGSAGTEDSLERSYQVEGKFFHSKTGLGNERETKQMLIEHDVLKRLPRGMAVLINKSKFSVSGIQIPKSDLFIS